MAARAADNAQLPPRRGPALLGIASLLCVLGWALPAAPAAAPSTSADFDGDGFSDLAIGAPLDSVGGHELAGAVNVLYGSSRRLREDPDQQFTQDTAGVRGVADDDDRFGSTMVAADYDDDGYADLAIGVPGESVSGVLAAGVVNVLYGGPAGLTARDELVGQGFAGVPGTREENQQLGAAVAAGDFDGDGHADLAVGAPRDSVGGAQAAGAVNVLYGADGGLRRGLDQLWSQDTAGVKGIAAPFHRLGSALATGDLDRDGRDDLAIGIPGGTIGGAAGAGAVLVLYGSASGLRADRDQLWSQGARGIKGAPEAGDQLGAALAVGDVDQDRDDDLAVGVPLEDVGRAREAGAAQVIYGSGRGLRPADELVHQGRRGIKGAPEEDDRFGSAITARDFERDGEDDLAIGVPGEDLRGRPDAGAVAVVYGSERSGVYARDDLWHQASAGIKGHPEQLDSFGLTVAAGDLDGDRRGDLAVGAPVDSVAGHDGAGAVNVIYGARGGLGPGRDQLWTQATRGIKGAVGSDWFGGGLATG
jgi:hypothetical protein